MPAKPGSRRSLLDRLRQAVKDDPQNARARVKLGMALAKTVSIHQAEQELRKAIELDPDLVSAWVNLGGVLLARFEFAGCVEANRRAQQIQPNLPEPYLNEGLGHMYLGNKDEMLACFERVVELDPDSASGNYHLAAALLAHGRLAEARASLTRATGLGYSPQPELLRKLEREERKRASAPADGATKSN